MADSGSEKAHCADSVSVKDRDAEPERTARLSKDPDWFAEMKWIRGTVCHWNDEKSVGGIRCDETQKQHFTFRKAFITKNRKYARPEQKDKVWWVGAPDSRNPKKTMAFRVVRDEDLVEMPEVSESIMNGQIDRYILRLDEQEAPAPKRPRDSERAPQKVFEKSEGAIKVSEKGTEKDSEKVLEKMLGLEKRLQGSKRRRKPETKEADEEYEDLACERDELAEQLDAEQKKRVKAEQKNCELM
eukprot:gene3904-1776_t